LAPIKATALGRITQTNCYYVVQGHSRSPLSITIEAHIWLPISTYIVSCTVSKISQSTGQLFVVNGKWVLKFRIAKYGLKKPEKLFYGMVQSLFWYLNRRHEWDRQTDSKCCAQLRCTADKRRVLSIY